MTCEEDYRALLRGLRELDFQGDHIPSDLVLIGDDAFPLAMNPRGQVLMAASRYGKGRVVVLGHEEHLTAFPKLVENAVAWLLASTESPALVGIHKSCSAVSTNLSCSSIYSEVGDFQKGFQAYVCDAYHVENSVKDMVAFLKAGGGLLLAGQAWKWAEAHPKQSSLLRFAANKVSSVAGIYFSEHQGETGKFQVPTQIPSSWLSVTIQRNFEDDLEFLLKGVSEFDIKGGIVASGIFIHGPLAFPIASTISKAFIAGAHYGQGRVIVVTHEKFLSRPSLSTFLMNALHWLDEGRKGVVGVFPKLKTAQKLLSKSGLKCCLTDFKEDLSVYVCTSYSKDHLEAIQDFVAEGGGLLIGGHAWNWAQKNHGSSVMTKYPGNQILSKMGLSIMGDTIKGEKFKAPEVKRASEGYHFRGGLQRFVVHVKENGTLSKHDENSLKKLGDDCASYLQMRNHNCPTYTSTLAILTNLVKCAGVPMASEKTPLKKMKDHVLLKIGTELYKVSQDPDDLLPYIIKEKQILPYVSNTRVSFSVHTHGGLEWISTGLYLSPGMRTHMSVPAQIVGSGWKVQIGCQTDNVGKAGVLKRAPVVHVRFPVDKEMILVWNLWGGLVYFIAPPKTKVENVEVVVQTAVRAPYYKSGVTSVADWVGGIRDAPAPWAELEFENLIITLNSKHIRKLERPDEVAKLWDDIMRGVADLSAKPAKFNRKERFVADVQISHGFMHAGYPIMMYCSSAPALINPPKARKSGLWGAIHELGHNQQRKAWELPPHTTEGTCNLWSVYINEEVLGVARDKAHANMALSKRHRRAKKFVEKGRNLDSWSVWTALETYMQLQEKFGWDAFKNIFAAYHKMKSVPNGKKSKMNLFAETFSKEVNMNLTPFFKAWGWPIESSTKERLSSLPKWSDHPMAQYT